MFFSILQLILLSIVVLLCVSLSMIGVIIVGDFFRKDDTVVLWRFKKYWHECYDWYKSNADNKIFLYAVLIVILLSIVVWSVPDNSESYSSKGFTFLKYLALEMQLIAISIGVVAAIIAYKNYQRKLGDELYYTTMKHVKNTLPNVSQIILYNAKDKASVVFAIDFLILDSEDRIRFFQNNDNPIIIPPYSSYVLKLDKTDKYTDNYMPDRFKDKNIKCIGVTYTGEVIIKNKQMGTLNKSFRQSCIFPQMCTNIPENYVLESFPRNATHWINIIESENAEFENDDGSVYEDIIESKYSLAGYFEDDILYIITESNNHDDTIRFLHGKSKSDIFALRNETQEQLNHDKYYFSQVVDFGIYSIVRMKFEDIGGC
ncbi:hypothetical protein J7620_03195 [Wohlfahrtiimonas chitiniclastica]|uniref:hypothetical protein n=1 Tax=Wohlfahrtiimonas chitiniclastica TaxID=400946 RepID=UPI001BD0EE4B|nr:hypothetical protein [Wohlfahrtiimonas chitiniclastica]MBS7833961.1 hypothetical protein [Wohlfahrtiimonas chitiniclastica]